MERIAQIATKTLNETELNKAIEEIWLDLRRHPDVLPPDLSVDLEGEAPIVVRQEGGNVGLAETFIVAVVGAVAKEVVASLWKDIIWPELQKRAKGLSEK